MKRIIFLPAMFILLSATILMLEGMINRREAGALTFLPKSKQPNLSQAAVDSLLARQSADSSLKYLAQAMDHCHERFWVYEDVSSPCNHFHAWAKIADILSAVEINGSYVDTTGNSRAGATVIRCVFRRSGNNYGGFYFQNGVLPNTAKAPLHNWGTYPNAGINLSGAVALKFSARGKNGGEKIEFFIGGVGRNPVSGAALEPYPDSSPRHPRISTIFTLARTWQEFTIDLTGLNLNYVLGGFAWVANAPNNPNGAEFYLDKIYYELNPAQREQRLNAPRFLRSFTTLPLQPDPNDSNRVDDFDLVLRNTAFVYDNTLALLAFLAGHTTDGLRRAKLIGDAFVYASQHDRLYNDGRLRDAYSAGDIALPPGWTPNGRTGTVPVPGFFNEKLQRFFEIEQTGISAGNNAWAMIALLALYERTQEQAYLDTARRLGDFIRTFRNNAGLYQGFQGGFDSAESVSPTRRAWASTEHNLDIFAAFTVMHQITGEPQWQEEALHARAFVEAMWDSTRGCYLTGTNDPNQRNTSSGQLPLDTQSWSVLALPEALALHPQLLACAEQNHRTSHDGFSGYDFNEDRDGVWFEGTAQMATAYAAARVFDNADNIRQELRRAQQTVPFGDGRGLAAACHDGVSTDFGFVLYRRLHVGATAWNVFAQLGLNPYYSQTTTRVDELGWSSTPARISLSQNYPNPFNPSTTIRYALPKSGFVTLKVYDLLGNEIASLVREPKSAGEYEVQWHSAGAPSGVYVYRLQVGNFVETKKLVLVR